VQFLQAADQLPVSCRYITSFQFNTRIAGLLCHVKNFIHYAVKRNVDLLCAQQYH